MKALSAAQQKLGAVSSDTAAAGHSPDTLLEMVRTPGTITRVRHRCIEMRSAARQRRFWLAAGATLLLMVSAPGYGSSGV
jgi:hypothetical protein